MSYQYVLVTLCMFSGWAEAFLCHTANALTVAKKLLENVSPIWVYLPQPPVITEPTSLGKSYKP